MSEEDARKRIVLQFVKDFNLLGHKVTLEQVSKEVRVSKKTIYKYFSSKMDIYFCIIDEMEAQFHEKQKKIYEDETLSVKEKLYHILTLELDDVVMPDFHKLINLSKMLDPVKNRLMEAMKGHWLYFKKIFAIAKKDGIVEKNLDADLVVMMLSSSYEAIFMTGYLERHNVSYSEAIKRIASVVLDGCYRKANENESKQQYV